MAQFPAGDYGWGFIKLEPLFMPYGQRFLILDSDTVITGPVLDWASKYDDDLIVDDERQTHEGVKSIYFDWTKVPKGGVTLHEPGFVFNSGQWFGRTGLLKREDFEGLIKWGFPTRLIDPNVFRNGEQGVLNFIVNERTRSGELRVARVPLMRWPGFGMDGLDAEIVSRRSGPPAVVHWAGMKKARLNAMVGADLLLFFEKYYYRRLPGKQMRRIIAACGHAITHWKNAIRERVTLRMKMMAGK